MHCFLWENRKKQNPLKQIGSLEKGTRVISACPVSPAMMLFPGWEKEKWLFRAACHFSKLSSWQHGARILFLPACFQFSQPGKSHFYFSHSGKSTHQDCWDDLFAPSFNKGISAFEGMPLLCPGHGFLSRFSTCACCSMLSSSAQPIRRPLWCHANNNLHVELPSSSYAY